MLFRSMKLNVHLRVRIGLLAKSTVELAAALNNDSDNEMSSLVPSEENMIRLEAS